MVNSNLSKLHLTAFSDIFFHAHMYRYFVFVSAYDFQGAEKAKVDII